MYDYRSRLWVSLLSSESSCYLTKKVTNNWLDLLFYLTTLCLYCLYFYYFLTFVSMNYLYRLLLRAINLNLLFSFQSFVRLTVYFPAYFYTREYIICCWVNSVFVFTIHTFIFFIFTNLFVFVSCLRPANLFYHPCFHLLYKISLKKGVFIPNLVQHTWFICNVHMIW